jgi:hypothetical protein
MMRAFFISAIVITLGFLVADVYYMDEVSSARYSSYSSDYSSYSDPYGYSGYSDYGSSNDDEMTVEAGLVTMAFFLVYIVLFVLSLIKVKTKTMKVFSIIGLSLTGIIALWDGVMISSPGNISFDEIGGAWLFFGVVMIAFTIIGTIHSFKAKA